MCRCNLRSSRENQPESGGSRLVRYLGFPLPMVVLPNMKIYCDSSWMCKRLSSTGKFLNWSSRKNFVIYLQSTPEVLSAAGEAAKRKRADGKCG